MREYACNFQSFLQFWGVCSPICVTFPLIIICFFILYSFFKNKFKSGLPISQVSLETIVSTYCDSSFTSKSECVGTFLIAAWWFPYLYRFLNLFSPLSFELFRRRRFIGWQCLRTFIAQSSNVLNCLILISSWKVSQKLPFPMLFLHGTSILISHIYMGNKRSLNPIIKE